MKSVLAAIALLAGIAPALAQQPPPGRLIGTAFNIADLNGAVKFYTEGLGMRVATTIDMGTRTETILMFGSDPAQPAILLMHDKDPAMAKPLTHGNAFSRLVVGVTDIEAIAARLTALGYAHGPIRNVSHGARILMVTDPAGFPLELVQTGPAH